MRMPAPAFLLLLLAAGIAPACSGNTPPAPRVTVAGWSWDPPAAGDHPLPVIWTGGASSPTPLPLLPGGTCTGSGTAWSLAMVSGQPVVVGIAALCNGDDQPLMLPVVWRAGASGAMEATRLPLPLGGAQGAALALVETPGGDVYVGGATGGTFPYPMIWKNGTPTVISPASLLPDGYDSGIVTAMQAVDQFIVGGGVVHRTGSSPPEFTAVVWVVDPDLIAAEPTLIPLPADVTAASFGPSTSIRFVGTTLFTAAALSTAPGQEKPVYWRDDVASFVAGDLGVAPFGSPTGLWMVAETPYSSGFLRSEAALTEGLPQPVLWGGTALERLSTVAPDLGLGAAEGIAVLYEHAYVAGETYAGTMAPGGTLVSVPAYWDNGGRHDLPGLVAAGSDPTLSRPLFGWWRVPGTPSSAPPDWPYAGAFAEIGAAPVPVAAAGSGVAKAIVVLPQ